MTFICFRPGFGGQKCDQCEENFWGDPRVECIPCNCNNLGVNPDKTQCDRTNGTCFCMKGWLYFLPRDRSLSLCSLLEQLIYALVNKCSDKNVGSVNFLPFQEITSDQPTNQPTYGHERYPRENYVNSDIWAISECNLGRIKVHLVNQFKNVDQGENIYVRGENYSLSNLNLLIVAIRLF